MNLKKLFVLSVIIATSSILFSQKSKSYVKMQFSISDSTEMPITPNYVLVDAALWDTDIDDFYNRKIPIYCLFRGKMGQELWTVAPFLAQLDEAGVTEKWIRSQDPYKRRVTWLQSKEDITTLRTHLRKFLRMKTDDGKSVFFRFYDPLVFNKTFPQLPSEQQQAFFEMIQYVITIDPKIDERRIYYMDANKKLKINVGKLSNTNNK